MKIVLNQYRENEDGSADFHVDMDKESTHSLINFALVTMLSKAVEEGKLYSPDFYEAEEQEKEEKKDDRVWVPLEPEQMDAIIVDELKNCLIRSYTNNLFFQEDVDNNIHVRNACKTLLNHYMIPSEADEYIGLIESVYEFEGA